MKTTSEYLDDYFDKQNELSGKGELWRLRVTPEEFIEEIERIRAYGKEARQEGILTEYHIQYNEEGMVSIMLMDKVTLEEMKEQCDRNKKVVEERFAKEAPEIQESLKLIQTPLSFEDTVHIYRWLCRKQITLEMMSKDVLDEFKGTEHYEKIVRRDDGESIL